MGYLVSPAFYRGSYLGVLSYGVEMFCLDDTTMPLRIRSKNNIKLSMGLNVILFFKKQAKIKKTDDMEATLRDEPYLPLPLLSTSPLAFRSSVLAEPHGPKTLN